MDKPKSYQEAWDAANQRISELEGQLAKLGGRLAVHDAFQHRFEATMQWQKQRAEDAERKLETARAAWEAIKPLIGDSTFNRKGPLATTLDEVLAGQRGGN